MKIRGIPILFPTSAWLGLFLISWLVIPRVTANFPSYSSSLILVIALLHALAIYVSVFVHELGHAFTAQKYGYQPKEIVLNLIGGHTAFARDFDTSKHQILIALFGPLANSLVIFFGFVLYLLNLHPIVESIAVWLMWASVITTIVNLLPGFPLDGGAILGGIVWAISGDRNAGLRANAIGGVILAGIWFLSPWILEVALGWEVAITDIVISRLIGSWLMLSSLRLLAFTNNPQKSEIETEINSAGALVEKFTRRAILINVDTDIQTALTEMKNRGAGSVIVVDTIPVGILREDAYDSSLVGKVQSFARRVDESDIILKDRTLEELADILANPAINEWIVIDEQNRMFGVLMRSDLVGHL
ncbi:MAG: M50 family metallopeptidase [Candidatus Nanopelagicales bacterium]